MFRLALIGANGQVGAELCLLLARLPEFALVPVCRTRSGSAFLRAHGIAVRHGSITDPDAAPGLVGDCALIVNSALATGSPAEIRATEDAIITNALRCAPAGARVVHFSTQSVYGDAVSGRGIRWRNPYGRAKLGTERSAIRAARAAGRELYLLRLGHVGGALQGISLDMRAALAAGEALLPARDVPSNLVYTVTIVEALRAIARGAVTPGVYDLMCVPQLGWRAVHEAECAIAGLDPAGIRIAPPPAPPSPAWRRALRGMTRLVSNEASRNTLAKLLAHAPRALNARAHAWWHRARARGEIAAMARNELPAAHLSWVDNGSCFIAGLTPTLELLAAAPYRDLLTGRAPWPADLPPAFAQVPAPAPRLLSTAT